MQRVDRTTWTWLIGSIVVAVGLVSLIPLYDLAGGHAEHGLGVQHTVATVDMRWSFRAEADGVEMQLVAATSADAAAVAQVRQVVTNRLHQYQFGDFGVGPGDTQQAHAPELTQMRDSIQIEYHELDAGAELVLTSDDDAVVAELHQWMAAIAHADDTQVAPNQ
jgi:hypothetical protein